MLCSAFFLLSRLACTEALLSSRKAVCAASMADFWFSWPLTASCQLPVPRLCRCRQPALDDFVKAWAGGVRGVGCTILIAPLAPGGIRGRRVEGVGENFSVFSATLKSFTPFDSDGSCSSSSQTSSEEKSMISPSLSAQFFEVDGDDAGS